MDNISLSLTNHTRLISEVQEKKVDKKDDKANRRQVEKRMKVIDEAHGVLMNQQIALESYVEKYMPLKL